jgi:hypothetical protein
MYKTCLSSRWVQYIDNNPSLPPSLPPHQFAQQATEALLPLPTRVFVWFFKDGSSEGGTVDEGLRDGGREGLVRVCATTCAVL